MRFSYGAFTHIGKVRKTNQDHYFAPTQPDNNLNLLIVADGMGGHNAGDVASKIAVESILESLKRYRLEGLEVHSKTILAAAIDKANSDIANLAKINAEYSKMGTTLTLASLNSGTMLVGHVGDSRAYLVKKGTAKQITKDHSIVQELFERGSITREQMTIHPNKNWLTRAMGATDAVDIDFYEIPIDCGDIIIVCSDGLNNYVELESLEEFFLTCHNIEDIVYRLGHLALEAGGADNITIVAAKCHVEHESRESSD